MRPTRFTSLPLGLALALGVVAHGQTWSVTQSFPIGGEGSWDYLTVDPSSHRLFVPRTTHTQIIDEDSGKVLGDVPGQKGAHGVAVVPKLNRGFITEGGGSGAILVFDLTTYATLGSIKTAPDSDGIIYDAKQDRVLAVSGDAGILMTFPPDINPSTGEVTSIALGGKPEFLATDGAGKVFINLADKDLVAVVDLKSAKVIARWPVAPGGSPVGMAFDHATGTLVIGCRKPQMMVFMSAATGKVTGSLPIGPGVDATQVDGAEPSPAARTAHSPSPPRSPASSRLSRSSRRPWPPAPWASTPKPTASSCPPLNSSRLPPAAPNPSPGRSRSSSWEKNKPTLRRYGRIVL
jgi:DNA-binding beta-propeller fold protein YncE